MLQSNTRIYSCLWRVRIVTSLARFVTSMTGFVTSFHEVTNLANILWLDSLPGEVTNLACRAEGYHAIIYFLFKQLKGSDLK